MTKDDQWNLAHCAVNRMVHHHLRGDTARALREAATAEQWQRMHSYTQLDRCLGADWR
jgi:hypothetical protein